MKVEYKLFIFLTPFFALIGVVYGLWSGWEPVGSAALLLTAGLSGMIGAYLALTAKRIDARPEDDPDGLIEPGAGDQGVYAPWSWWPLVLAAGAGLLILGFIGQFWISFGGAAVVIIGVVGWVYEYYRGNFAR